ncbi:MAG: prenyltransferase [Candidatus Thermoplasmatota archaeon]|nr:prenyltransferase [Candidatus Thermoplasmatota archaeon]MBS3790199.1 prenyltransferase [Candidatus Thermoplasmatota archaeon]
MSKKPNILEMARAPFLFAIVVPLAISTLLSVHITGRLNLLGLTFASLLGISLHVTTNVYNDIYDTKQGADTSRSAENEFSGGSGILVNHPDMEKSMLTLARTGIVLGTIGYFGLLLISESKFWPTLTFIFLVSVFLSKYYTAGPFQFAYRGLGEIVVWFGFGPLAVLLGAIGQNVGFHPYIISIMPITGLSTLFIVWMGQMVDLPDDKAAGKRGLVARMGLEKSVYGLLFIHILALINVIFVSFLLNPGRFLLVALIPHGFLLPLLFKKLSQEEKDKTLMREISKLNFILYVLFSVSLMIGFLFQLMAEI